LVCSLRAEEPPAGPDDRLTCRASDRRRSNLRLPWWSAS